MFSSPWIRKPDFKNTKEIDYNDYWKHRGWQLNTTMKPRESVMLGLVPPGSKVIDIGCGNSLLPVKLKDKGCTVSVGDISDIVLEQYKKLGIDGAKIDLRDTKNIKLPQKFDYIILSEVLEHIHNPEQVIAALKPFTDRFLITVPNSASYEFRYGLMFKGRFFTQWVYHPGEHLRFWSHIDFLEWLEARGLQVEKMEASDGFTLKGMIKSLPNVWKNLLAFRVVYVCKILN